MAATSAAYYTLWHESVGPYSAYARAVLAYIGALIILLLLGRPVR